MLFANLPLLFQQHQYSLVSSSSSFTIESKSHWFHTFVILSEEIALQPISPKRRILHIQDWQYGRMAGTFVNNILVQACIQYVRVMNVRCN
jgi:hypothetical protein